MLSATRKGGGSWNSRGSHRCLWCTFISFEIQRMILMLPSQFRSDGDDGRCLENNNGVCRCHQPDLSPRAILFRPAGSAYFPAANKAKASASGGDKKFCRSPQPIQLELRCRHHPSHCLRGLRDWCPAWPSQLSWWQSSDTGRSSGRHQEGLSKNMVISDYLIYWHMAREAEIMF